ncbi:hypothetical protein Q1695_001414 [Nippostrongylus brasiliensis]|nr:hypothetical protein Q1695_001414 [Nippostrongylus brasiliensis]
MSFCKTSSHPSEFYKWKVKSPKGASRLRLFKNFTPTDVKETSRSDGIPASFFTTKIKLHYLVSNKLLKEQNWRLKNY